MKNKLLLKMKLLIFYCFLDFRYVLKIIFVVTNTETKFLKFGHNWTQKERLVFNSLIENKNFLIFSFYGFNKLLLSLQITQLTHGLGLSQHRKQVKTVGLASTFILCLSQHRFRIVVRLTQKERNKGT